MAGPTIASAEVDVDFDGSGLPQQARRIATQAGRAFSGEFSDEVNDHLAPALSPAGRRIAKAMGDVGQSSGRTFTDRLADEVESRLSGFDDDLASAVVSGDWDAAVRRMGGVSRAADSLKIRLRDLQRQGQLTAEQVDTISASFDRYRDSLELSAEQERRRQSLAKATRRATQRSNDEEERSFSLLGRLTGSRNDFLNIVGKTARALERLPQLFSRAGSGVQNLVGRLAQATEGFSGLQRILVGLRAGFTGALQGLKGLLGKGGIAGAGVTVAILAGALLALGNIITGVAAGLSALTGIVTALASSISAALGGALVSVGPIIGALAAGIGGLTIAIVKNQDAFAKAVKPLSDWTDEVGKAAGKSMLPSLTSAAETLADVLSDKVTPLLAESAGAVGKWADSFAEALDSGPMRKNLDVFATTWPAILRNLGDIFTDVFTGLSGIFAAISPSVERFTGLIADAVEEFSEWANSAGGKNTVKEWFDGAWESATLLWDIITNVAGAIGNLFDQGKGTGDSLLGALEGITAQFEAWTGSEKGREAIRQWFEDARDLASTLGDLIGNIATKFDEWDTPRNRQDFEDMVDAVSGILGGIMDVVTWLNKAVDASADFLDNLGWDNLFDGSDFLTEWWDGTVMPWWNGTVIPWVQGIPGAIGNGLVSLGATLASTFLTAWAAATAAMIEAGAGIIAWVAALPGRIVGALASLAAPLVAWATSSWIRAQTATAQAAGRIVAWVAALPGRIMGSLVSLGARLAAWAIGAWTRAYLATSSVAGRLVNWVAGLPGRIMGGLISLGARLSAWAIGAWTRAYLGTVGVAARIVGWVAGLPGRIMGGLISLGARLAAWAIGAWTRAYLGMVSGGARIVNWVAGLPGRILGAIGNLGSLLYSTGVSIVDGLYRGLVDAWGRVTSWASDAAGGLSGAVRKVLGIASPSKVFMKIGEDTVAGFVLGFRKSTEKGRGAFQQLAQTSLRSMTDALGKGAEEAAKEVSGILAKVRDLQIAAIKDNQKALANAIKSVRNADLSSSKEAATIAHLRAEYARMNQSIVDAGATIRSNIRKNASELVTTLRDYEQVTRQLEAARKTLDEMRKLRTEVADSLRGQLNLGSLVSSEEGAGQLTFGAVAGYVAAMKSKAQTFATKMKALVNAGLPPALVQQIAGLGLDAAIEVSNALLAGSPKQLSKLKQDFSAFNQAANSVGGEVVKSMYGLGIEAQKGLIEGLVEDQAGLKKAAKTLTDRLTRYVRQNLGIKSPSRVFASLGQQVMAGMAQGITRGTSGVLSAMGSATSALSAVTFTPGVQVSGAAGSGGVAVAAGAVMGRGRTVIVQPGAIQVVTPVADPYLVAAQVLDRMMVRAG